MMLCVYRCVCVCVCLGYCVVWMCGVYYCIVIIVIVGLWLDGFMCVAPSVCYGFKCVECLHMCYWCLSWSGFSVL